MKFFQSPDTAEIEKREHIPLRTMVLASRIPLLKFIVSRIPLDIISRISHPAKHMLEAQSRFFLQVKHRWMT